MGRPRGAFPLSFRNRCPLRVVQWGDRGVRSLSPCVSGARYGCVCRAGGAVGRPRGAGAGVGRGRGVPSLRLDRPRDGHAHRGRRDNGNGHPGGNNGHPGGNNGHPG
eukprot:6778583-Pyramimonas_sp.AAC.1